MPGVVESSRRVFNLGGMWQCCPDNAAAAGQPLEDAAWGEIVVPSNWHLAGLPNYAGTVWFRRRFGLPRSFGRLTTGSSPAGGGSEEASPTGKGSNWRARLLFLGVDYFAEVWLNGVRLGEHEGYFAPFEFEVTDVLGAENELLVRVSAPREAPGDWPAQKRLVKGIFQHHDCRPGAWNPERGQDGGTGGIWNRVELEIVPAAFLVSLRVDARPPREEGSPARLTVWVETDSATATRARLALGVNHPASGGNDEPLVDTAIDLAAERQEHRFELELADPRLWWTWDQGEPELYGLRTTLETADGLSDQISTEFGIRELRVADDSTWWLNGRRIFPRGTNIIPTQWLASYDEAAIERDLALLARANVNAIRVHAHVNREELYEACNRVGIMVWQDFALQWSYQETDELRDAALRQIAEMGRHLHNHPSIVVWCCHNEPSFNRQSLDPLLAGRLREVDPSRHLEEASDFRTHPYPGWYWSGLDEFRSIPSGPFVSEFGAQALPGREALEAMFALADLWPPNWRAWAYHDFQYDQTVNVAGLPPGDSLDDWIRRSQEYQARLLQVAIESYRRAKYRPISGLFQFMFVECWDAISWGLLDYQRRPKAGYEALRQAYQPLLPSIDLRREHCLPGGEIQAGFWLVNDFPHAYEDLRLAFGLRDQEGRVWWSEERGVPRLEADGVLPIFSIQDSGFPWRAPKDAPPGEYAIFSELYDAAGACLASNWCRFEIRPSPAGL